eukprot:6012747-Amphidinium_carterae.1
MIRFVPSKAMIDLHNASRPRAVPAQAIGYKAEVAHRPTPTGKGGIPTFRKRPLKSTGLKSHLPDADGVEIIFPETLNSTNETAKRCGKQI